MDRAPGLSVRLKLTLSYAGFLVLAGALLLALWVVLLRYFPHAVIIRATRSGIGGAFAPGRSSAQQVFGQAAAIVLAFLLLFGDVRFQLREHGVEGIGELAELIATAR